MDALKSLKETHPQKHYLKLMCRFIYYIGIGDCWYEETVRSKTHKALYGLWAFSINAFIILGTANEVLANFRSDLEMKEKNDLIQFTFAHPSLCAKYIILVFQKQRVRDLFKRMIDGTRSVYSSSEVDRQSVRKAKMYFVCLATVTYGTLFFSLMDGVMTHIKLGIPIRTEVVLYPKTSDSGIIVDILRPLVEFHWWTIVTNMLLVDCLSFFSLVCLRYKFRIVMMYFDDLRKKMFKNKGIKNRMALTEEFRKDFVIGIKLHEDALWCAQHVQYALGNLYSVQVFETIALLIMCLVRLVTNERNLIFLLSIMAYITCLIVLTGAYFTAAGDVTCEASEVCTSMFHCGWELVTASRELRSLAVVAVQRSQAPVYMTAFGVIRLSHPNFITVMRSSYSFFAVMY